MLIPFSACRYFFKYQKDRFRFRAVVALVLLFSVVDTICVGIWNYRWTVTYYGDPSIMELTPMCVDFSAELSSLTSSPPRFTTLPQRNQDRVHARWDQHLCRSNFLRLANAFLVGRRSHPSSHRRSDDLGAAWNHHLGGLVRGCTCIVFRERWLAVRTLSLESFPPHS